MTLTENGKVVQVVGVVLFNGEWCYLTETGAKHFGASAVAPAIELALQRGSAHLWRVIIAWKLAEIKNALCRLVWGVLRHGPRR